MSMIEREIVEISVDKLEGIEEMFFKQIQMDPAKARKRFSSLMEETKSALFSSIKIQAIMESFPIDCIEQDTIRLGDGTEIESEMLSHLFQSGEELILHAITVHGYDSFEEDTNSMNRLFYDAWGTAVVEMAGAYFKDLLEQKISLKNKYASFSWSPGQHNVDIHLQEILFQKLQPGEIGISLNSGMMMHPKKSVSGFIAVGQDPGIKTTRACDFCRLRKKCPSAYAS